MEINAQSLKNAADNFNNKKFNTEYSTLLVELGKRAEAGKYNYHGIGDLMPETIKALKELGLKLEFGGRMNEPDYQISWKDGKTIAIKVENENDVKIFYADGVIGKGILSKEAYIAYVNELIERFDNLCWGGRVSKHWSTEFTDVVVVYEAGVKGPADWFYLNKEHKWAHGGYTANKQTYTNSEFLQMISRIVEQNKKY